VALRLAFDHSPLDRRKPLTGRLERGHCGRTSIPSSADYSNRDRSDRSIHTGNDRGCRSYAAPLPEIVRWLR